MSEEEKKPEEQKTEETKVEWDKTKQQIDQLTATVTKLSGQLEDSEGERASILDELTELKSAIKTEAKKTEGVSLEAVDEDLVGKGVPKNFQILVDKYNALEGKYSALEKEAKVIQEERAAAEAEKAQKETIEEILGPLDEEFGAKYRTPAKKLADKKIEDGTEKHPKGNVLRASRLMRRCYKELYEADQKKAKKETVPTDSGTAGVPFSEVKGKTGTKQEVLADLKKRGGWSFGEDSGLA
ncbi:MAG: hypothetical protein ACYSR6_09790 [Planctomycetota bacterium]|jgi:hypothetical protein